MRDGIWEGGGVESRGVCVWLMLIYVVEGQFGLDTDQINLSDGIMRAHLHHLLTCLSVCWSSACVPINILEQQYLCVCLCTELIYILIATIYI